MLVGLLFDGHGEIPLRGEESSGLPPSHLRTARRDKPVAKGDAGAPDLVGAGFAFVESHPAKEVAKVFYSYHHLMI